tara:strand:- start:1010 stop:1309 length:300 start_codon:yes stop_codon:yes gene_type:complete
MLKKSILAFAALLIVTPALANGCGKGGHAHDLHEMAIKYFGQMDTNGDDVVTKEEFEAFPFSKMLKSFGVLQPNEDGVVEKKSFIETFVKKHSHPKTEA